MGIRHGSHTTWIYLRMTSCRGGRFRLDPGSWVDANPIYTQPFLKGTLIWLCLRFERGLGVPTQGYQTILPDFTSHVNLLLRKLELDKRMTIVVHLREFRNGTPRNSGSGRKSAFNTVPSSKLENLAQLWVRKQKKCLTKAICSPWTFNSSPLKNDGWKTILSF